MLVSFIFSAVSPCFFLNRNLLDPLAFLLGTLGAFSELDYPADWLTDRSISGYPWLYNFITITHLFGSYSRDLLKAVDPHELFSCLHGCHSLFRDFHLMGLSKVNMQHCSLPCFSKCPPMDIYFASHSISLSLSLSPTFYQKMHEDNHSKIK